MLVAEIQQASDTTYRLFDWNRVGPDGKPRALHVAGSTAAIAYSAGPAPWLARVYHTEDVDAAIEMVLETLDDLLCARDEERLRAG